MSLAADNSSNIDYIDINYIAPMSKNDKYITLKFNAKTNLFEGDIKIDEEFEDGKWVIRSIYATDLKGEDVYDKYFDSLPSGNFSVSGVRSEINIPKFDYDSLEVTKKIATKGDIVTISAKITDDSKLESVDLRYNHGGNSPDGLYKTIKMVYNSKSDRYEVSFLIDENSYIGTWRIAYISAKDNNQNYMQWDNRAFWQGNGSDLTAGEFEVVPSVEKTSVSYSTHVQSKGWMSAVSNGELSGTKGESKRM